MEKVFLVVFCHLSLYLSQMDMSNCMMFPLKNPTVFISATVQVLGHTCAQQLVVTLRYQIKKLNLNIGTEIFLSDVRSCVKLRVNLSVLVK